MAKLSPTTDLLSITKDILNEKVKEHTDEYKNSERPSHYIDCITNELKTKQYRLILKLVALGASIAITDKFDFNEFTDEEKALISHRLFEYKADEASFLEEVKEMQEEVRKYYNRKVEE